MTHVLDCYVVLAIEVHLERQNHEHSIYIALQRVDPVSAPGPDLRTDVVDGFQPGAMKSPSETHIEVRPVDQDYRRGAPRQRRANQLAVSAKKIRKLSKHLTYAYSGDRADVHEEVHASLAHLVASRTENIEVCSRIERGQ